MQLYGVPPWNKLHVQYRPSLDSFPDIQSAFSLWDGSINYFRYVIVVYTPV